MEDKYLHKAKRTDNGEWVQGYLVYDNRDKMYRIITEISYSTGTCLTADIAPRVDLSTICRCTGLKDENGMLIWENDIIHKPYYTDYDAYANSEAYTGRIQYEDGGWSVEITKPDGNVCVSPIIEMIAYSKDIEYCEVIGNIFDNKELLESEG